MSGLNNGAPAVMRTGPANVVPPPPPYTPRTMMRFSMGGPLIKGSTDLNNNPAPDGVVPFGKAIYKTKLGNLPLGFELDDNMKKLEIRYVHGKVQLFNFVDVLTTTFKDAKTARQYCKDTFQPDENILADNSKGKIKLDRLSYEVVLMPTHKHPTNELPVYGYFAKMKDIAEYLVLKFPDLGKVCAQTHLNATGMQGRAGAASVAMSAADVAFNPLNTSADGLGGAAGQLTMDDNINAYQNLTAMVEANINQMRYTIETSINEGMQTKMSTLDWNLQGYVNNNIIALEGHMNNKVKEALDHTHHNYYQALQQVKQNVQDLQKQFATMQREVKKTNKVYEKQIQTLTISNQQLMDFVKNKFNAEVDPVKQELKRMGETLEQQTKDINALKQCNETENRPGNKKPKF